jgi:CDP-diacylglycerol--glycerol-3-phosphate 3-phosphatidyltransferase
MNIIDKIMGWKEAPAKKVVKYLPDWLTPNMLTLWRILMLLPVVFFILAGHFLWALMFFIIGALFDYLDGPLARERGQVSEFGKLFDPTADKLLFLIVLFLVGWTRIAHWLLWGVFILEALLIVIVLIFKQILEKRGIKRKVGANIFGKLKMFAQVIALTILLLHPNSLHFVRACEIFLVISLPLSIASVMGHLLGRRE